jgi:glyoxylase-like metal-dependent hydrolase (beta-lactamase superfamily II)
MGLNENIVVPIKLGSVSVFLIKGSKPILIDTGYKNCEDKIIKAIESSCVNPKDIELIIITHGHNDHFGSAKALREKIGAKIAIHKKDVDNIIEGTNGNLEPKGIFLKVLFFISKLFSKKSEDEGLEPDIIIEDEISLNSYGVNGRVIFTPGHTKGSISIILDNGDAIIGDLLMKLLPWGKPSKAAWAEDAEESDLSIKKVIGQAPRNIYMSHGGVTSMNRIGR